MVQGPLFHRHKTSASTNSWHLSHSPSPTSCPETTDSLPDQLRSVMRLVAHPVVVCTASHAGTPRAMTMSSFTSLSLSPAPLVSFNIATPSRTLDAISASGHFNIHIMAGDAKGAALADRFTRGNLDDGLFDGVEGAEGVSGAPGAGAGEAPVLDGEGVLYVLRCRLLDDEPMRGRMRVRDHVIVVGEVVEVIPRQGAKEFGLAYADRRYRQLGEVISKDG